MHSKQEAAAAYAADGLKIFPAHWVIAGGQCSCGKADCGHAGKHPRVKWKEKATDEALQVQRWWQAFPDANIGLPTGVDNGIVVLDVDPKAGGFDSLEKFQAEHGAFDTVTARTGSGGLHFVFQHPGGRIENSVSQVADGIDIRGDGGYIIVAPSNHVSGGVYQWETSILHRQPAPLPVWLANLLSQGQTLPLPSPPSERRTGADKRFRVYVDRILEGEARKVSAAQEGTRNQTLNTAAFVLGTVAGSEWSGLTPEEVEVTLLAAAELCGLTPAEARATIHSGLQAGMKKPRSQPAEPRETRGGQQPKNGKTVIPARFALKAGGLWFGEPDENTGEIDHKHKVCGRLEVAAATTDPQGRNEGRLLRFKTRRDQWRELVIPMRALVSDGRELCGQLADLGLRINNPYLSKTRQRIAEYINDCDPSEQYTSTEQTGWHDQSFVLTGSEVIGNGGKVIFAGADTRIYAQSGTLAQWQQNVAKFCEGNSRLEFAVSLAFTGVLMPLTGDDGAGANFYGTTSTGKSTAQIIASSVWGNPAPGGFISKWNATATGLEIQAVQRNHTVFCIDELGEVDPKLAGRLIYQLASGVQKGRGRSTDGGAIGMADLKTWKMPFLSSAEKTLQQHVEEAGQRLYGGQAVRCVDIPADAGAGFGVFEKLYGFAEQYPDDALVAGGAFSDLLKANTGQYHGAAGRAFVTALLKTGIPGALKLTADVRSGFNAGLPVNISGVARRAAKLFSLAAAAGELAIHLGILPWLPGRASQGVGRCFSAWLEENGTGNPEERAALSQVQYFLEAHGDARFRGWNEDPDGRVIQNHAGWAKEDETHGLIYFIKPEIFKREVCKGYNHSFVLKLLEARGALDKSPGKMVKEIKKQGCRFAYAVKFEKLSVDSVESVEK